MEELPEASETAFETDGFPPATDPPLSPKEYIGTNGLLRRMYINHLTSNLESSDQGTLYAYVPFHPVRQLLKRSFARQFGNNYSDIMAEYRSRHT